MNNGIFTISTGAGFHPSTILKHPKTCYSISASLLLQFENFPESAQNPPAANLPGMTQPKPDRRFFFRNLLNDIFTCQQAIAISLVAITGLRFNESPLKPYPGSTYVQKKNNGVFPLKKMVFGRGYIRKLVNGISNPCE